MKNINTVPNIVTLIRLISVPFIVLLILNGSSLVATTLFIIVVLSDKLDGYLARTLKQETKFGGTFDAVTDSILIYSTAITLLVVNDISLYFLFPLIIPRCINGLLLLAFYSGKYKATIYSRVATVFVYALIGVFLLAGKHFLINPLFIGLYALSVVHWIILVKER